MKKITSFVIALFYITNANAMNVEDYIDQVEQNNKLYSSSKEGEVGYKLQSAEPKLQYSPKFFTNLQTIDDKRKTNSPAFQGNETKTDNISSGFSMLNQYGTESKIYYSQSKNTISGVNPTFLSMPQYYSNGWNLELTQHLWQDGFGSKTRSLSKANEASSLASVYNNKYQQKSTILEARTKFWQLAATLESIKIYKQAIEIAQKTYNYLQNKKSLGLAERGDVIKIEAYLVSKKYDLENALLNYSNQLIDFNNIRGADKEEVVTDIKLPDASYIKSLQLPEVDFERDDIKAKKQTMITSSENYKASEHNYKPSLDLVLSSSVSGRSSTYNQTMQDANNARYPYNSVSLNFSIPLDISKVKNVTAGYRSMEKSAKLAYDQSVQDAQASLKKLIAQFEKDKHLLSLMNEVVDVQSKKVEEERRRYKLGKTDIYQLCLIEQEYLTAKNNFVALKQSVLTLYDQISTYKKD